MTTLRFDITLPDGTKESVETDAERVLIGRAAHCEVGFGVAELASEHVAVEVVGDVVRLISLAFVPPPVLNGETVTVAIVQHGAVLRIGTVSIVITRIGAAALVGAKSQAKRRVNLVSGVGAVAALTLLAMVALQAASPSRQAPTAAPELWDRSVPACPANTPAQAGAFAAEKRVVADGKRERHPFYVAEGVEAVTLYELSAACFRKAGDGLLADELAATARQLRDDVNDDYRVRRLRLERALAAKNVAVAAHEVVMLRSLISGKGGSYVEWINNLARKFEVDKEAS
ncbi:MAG TPA: hypothetical protein VIV60_08005 [Polyangiaceae bacterium]